MLFSAFQRVAGAIVLFVVPLCAVAAAEKNRPWSRSNIKVVASISPIADMVKNVGGDRVSVSHFVPLDVDPHTYEPTFSSLQSIAQAEMIFLNGDGLDRAARENLMALRNRRCQIVDLSLCIPPDKKNGIDPHYWLDPQLAESYVAAIRENLSALAPGGRDQFYRNAASYLQRIAALDAHYKSLCEKLPPRCRGLVLYHNSWTHLATRYGFNVVGIIETFGTHETSARQLAMLIRKARSVGARAILAEHGHGSRLLATVKEEARIPVVLEMVEDSLIHPPYDTYLGMMEANLQKLTAEICKQ